MTKTAEVTLDLDALALEVLSSIRLRTLGERGRQTCRDEVALEAFTQGITLTSGQIEALGDEVWHVILRELWIAYLPEGCVVKDSREDVTPPPASRKVAGKRREPRRKERRR